MMGHYTTIFPNEIGHGTTLGRSFRTLRENSSFGVNMWAHPVIYIYIYIYMYVYIYDYIYIYIYVFLFCACFWVEDGPTPGTHEAFVLLPELISEVLLPKVHSMFSDGYWCHVQDFQNVSKRIVIIFRARWTINN